MREDPREDLRDAQALHRARPDTFEVPDDADLNGLRAGDLVKVCRGGERFWVRLASAGEVLEGSVEGSSPPETIAFHRKNVYDISRPREAAAFPRLTRGVSAAAAFLLVAATAFMTVASAVISR